MSVPEQLKNIIEAALLAAGRPLSLDAMQGLFHEIECPSKKDLREVLQQLTDDYSGRGIEIAEVGSGWRIQVGAACSPWVSRLWDERPARYSRALMETLALIAYRQPITRGEIEDIRGVSVSTNIVKTLIEREWVHVVGHRDVPGRPSLYGTTREFLDYFGLRSLDDLPTLAELRDLDEINRELDLEDPDKAAVTAASGDAGTAGPGSEADDADRLADGHRETPAQDAGEVAAEAADETATESPATDASAGGIPAEAGGGLDTAAASEVDPGTAAEGTDAVDEDADASTSRSDARAADETAEVRDADGDIRPVYAQPEAARDTADGIGAEVASVVEPERT